MSKNLNDKVTTTMDNTDEEIFLKSFHSVKSISTSRASSEAGVMSIINSKKNGRRITLSKSLWEQLNKPEAVQVSMNETAVSFGEKVPDGNLSFSLKAYKGKYILYASPLVEEITKEFGLNFSQRTSLTFHEVKFMTIDGCTVAFVTVIS